MNYNQAFKNSQLESVAKKLDFQLSPELHSLFMSCGTHFEGYLPSEFLFLECYLFDKLMEATPQSKDLLNEVITKFSGSGKYPLRYVIGVLYKAYLHHQEQATSTPSNENTQKQNNKPNKINFLSIFDRSKDTNKKNKKLSNNFHEQIEFFMDVIMPNILFGVQNEKLIRCYCTKIKTLSSNLLHRLLTHFIQGYYENHDPDKEPISNFGGVKVYPKIIREVTGLLVKGVYIILDEFLPKNNLQPGINFNGRFLDNPYNTDFNALKDVLLGRKINDPYMGNKLELEFSAIIESHLRIKKVVCKSLYYDLPYLEYIMVSLLEDMLIKTQETIIKLLAFVKEKNTEYYDYIMSSLKTKIESITAENLISTLNMEKISQDIKVEDYQSLGLSSNANLTEIRAAYQKRLTRFSLNAEHHSEQEQIEFIKIRNSYFRLASLAEDKVSLYVNDANTIKNNIITAIKDILKKLDKNNNGHIPLINALLRLHDKCNTDYPKNKLVIILKSIIDTDKDFERVLNSNNAIFSRLNGYVYEDLYMRNDKNAKTIVIYFISLLTKYRVTETQFDTSVYLNSFIDAAVSYLKKNNIKIDCTSSNIVAKSEALIQAIRNIDRINHLLTIDNSILYKIAGFLSVKDIISLSRTDKHLKKVFSDSNFWNLLLSRDFSPFIAPLSKLTTVTSDKTTYKILYNNTLKVFGQAVLHYLNIIDKCDRSSLEKFIAYMNSPKFFTRPITVFDDNSTPIINNITARAIFPSLSGKNLLEYAFMKGDSRTIQILVTKVLNILNESDAKEVSQKLKQIRLPQNKTVMHLAVADNPLNSLYLLMDNELINSVDETNKTPLHYAVEKGHSLQLIFILLLSGANLTLLSNVIKYRACITLLATNAISASDISKAIGEFFKVDDFTDKIDKAIDHIRDNFKVSHYYSPNMPTADKINWLLLFLREFSQGHSQRIEEGKFISSTIFSPPIIKQVALNLNLKSIVQLSISNKYFYHCLYIDEFYRELLKRDFPNSLDLIENLYSAVKEMGYEFCYRLLLDDLDSLLGKDVVNFILAINRRDIAAIERQIKNNTVEFFVSMRANLVSNRPRLLSRLICTDDLFQCFEYRPSLLYYGLEKGNKLIKKLLIRTIVSAITGPERIDIWRRILFIAIRDDDLNLFNESLQENINVNDRFNFIIFNPLLAGIHFKNQTVIDRILELNPSDERVSYSALEMAIEQINPKLVKKLLDKSFSKLDKISIEIPNDKANDFLICLKLIDRFHSMERMPTTVDLETIKPGVIYLEQLVSSIRYVVLDPAGKVVEGIFDVSELKTIGPYDINMNGALDIGNLNNYKNDILKITSNKGHTSKPISYSLSKDVLASLVNNKNFEVLQYLLDISYKKATYILHCAVETNNYEVAHWFITKCEKKIDSKDSANLTALDKAVQASNARLVILLLLNGATPKINIETSKDNKCRNLVSDCERLNKLWLDLEKVSNNKFTKTDILKFTIEVLSSWKPITESQHNYTLFKDQQAWHVSLVCNLINDLKKILDTDEFYDFEGLAKRAQDIYNVNKEAKDPSLLLHLKFLMDKFSYMTKHAFTLNAIDMTRHIAKL